MEVEGWRLEVGGGVGLESLRVRVSSGVGLVATSKEAPLVAATGSFVAVLNVNQQTSECHRSPAEGLELKRVRGGRRRASEALVGG